MRYSLQKQLLAAWEESIAQDYCNQRINSERSLQASVWSNLNRILSHKTRRIFIEPHFSLTVDGKISHRYPDIVICNQVAVIAVIELKYQPRMSPSYQKDIETLRLISKHRNVLKIATSRFRGLNRNANEFSFSDSVLFAWAGINRKPKSAAFKEPPMLAGKITELDGCFLELHAETSRAGGPTIFSRRS